MADQNTKQCLHQVETENFHSYKQVESSQVAFIYIALLTIQIVTKQLHNIEIGKLFQ